MAVKINFSKLQNVLSSISPWVSLTVNYSGWFPSYRAERLLYIIFSKLSLKCYKNIKLNWQNSNWLCKQDESAFASVWSVIRGQLLKEICPEVKK